MDGLIDGWMDWLIDSGLIDSYGWMEDGLID